jgi:MoxR-like ATPase
MNDLYTLLNAAGYICGKKFASLVEACLHTMPVAGAFLNGSIGTGKTFLTEIVSRVIPSKYHFYQCFPGTREEELLLKMLPHEETISGIATYDGIMIEAVKSTYHNPHEKVVLVLDEWDKTRPSADSFLLDFLQTGRIKYAHYDLQADLSKLIIFLTLNMEREISEPLLRRLPVIDFSPLSPALVFKALKSTHPKHPFLFNVMVLYERSLQADLPKPATIQELRQFLDALTFLGSDADWDSLVFQFVTKTQENHELLRKTEKEKVKRVEKSRSRLDIKAYSSDLAFSFTHMLDHEDMELPSLKDSLRFDPSLGAPEEDPDLSSATGVLKKDEGSYDALVRLLEEPSDVPHVLGELARVHGEYITLNYQLHLMQINLIEPLWGKIGEILLIEPKATMEDVRSLQNWSDIRIIKFSKKEILARTEGIDLRWTPERGAEIIIDLMHKRSFQECFGSAWGAIGEDKWIGEQGSVYHRYKRENPNQNPNGIWTT